MTSRSNAKNTVGKPYASAGLPSGGSLATNRTTGQADSAALMVTAVLVSLLIASGIGGCASYRVGAETLYAPDIATVYLPMFESDSFRRDLGERLTEAVAKEIELKTPFKVVGTPDADSVLSIRMLNDQKRVTIENQNDDPRALEFNLATEVTWFNRRRIPIQPVSTIPLPPALLPVGQTSTLIPGVGQSVVTAQQQAIQRLAERIVATMEEPW